MSKRTLVIGASKNTERYSNKAVRLLRSYMHEVVAVGVEEGQVEDVRIETTLPEKVSIHTVTLYVNPAIQPKFYDQIIALKPRRIIFNPGTENLEFEKLAAQHKIETERACTLVLLNTGQY